jgi:hypothetical protein
MKYRLLQLISIVFISLQTARLYGETDTTLAFSWFLQPARPPQTDVDRLPIAVIMGNKEEQKPRRQWIKNSVKARAAVFEPTDSKIRRNCGEWWAEYSGEYNRYFHPQWSFFINGAFATKHSSYLIPVTLGVNARLGQVSFWHPYIGLGIGGVYGHLQHHGKGHQSSGGLAALAQAGMEFDLGRWFFLDLFGTYRWNWFHLNSTRKHTLAGGWVAGGGLGVRF